MQLRDFNTKSFWRISAIKSTYWHALVGPEHEIFSAIFSYQEYLLTYIGGTLTQIFSVVFSYQENLLTCIGGTWIRNLFGDLQLSRILIVMHWWDLNIKSFRRISAIKNTFWHALVVPEHEIFSAIFSDQECMLICIGVTWPKNRFGDFRLSRTLFDMHCWDLNVKSFRWMSAIKNANWHALVGFYHKIFSLIFSYQEHLFTCIIGT